MTSVILQCYYRNPCKLYGNRKDICKDSSINPSLQMPILKYKLENTNNYEICAF